MTAFGARLTGVVTLFDVERGLGSIRANGGADHEFHCVEIADGTRTIPVGATVTFELLPKLGRYEAAKIIALSTDPAAERERRIIDVLMSLGEGEVTTYGDVADVAGYPKHSRLVGRILATTEADVPWWRVVNAAGRLVAGKPGLQARLLAEENVVVRDDRIVAAPVGRFARLDG